MNMQYSCVLGPNDIYVKAGVRHRYINGYVAGMAGWIKLMRSDVALDPVVERVDLKLQRHFFHGVLYNVLDTSS